MLMSAQRIASMPGSPTQELQDKVWEYPLFDALYGRRTRRFGLGFEITEGPFRYQSRHAPVPLTEAEEALLVAAGAGVSGLALWDQSRPSANRAGGARTFPSISPATHRTQLLFTNDQGVYATDAAHASASVGPAVGWQEQVASSSRSHTHAGFALWCLFVGSQFRHQGRGLQALLHLGNGGLHIGDGQSVGWSDRLDAEPCDQVIEPIAVHVHVGELGPKQSQICKR